MPRTIFIIDAFAQIFRAYFALRGGMNSPITSEPTHAVFGFTSMLMKLLSQHNPEYVVVATECAGKTFRDELHAEYKGTREAVPDDLISQIPRVFEVIELLGIPVYSAPKMEADDVIATIVHRLAGPNEESDFHVRIISKDKDLEQLLSDRVALYDIHTDVTIDTAALMANKGIRPEQVIDLLALTGDTVDNVPGVPGIGPKTASLLLQQYDTIEGILANLKDLTPKKRETLEAARVTLPLSQHLVTLRRDAEFEFTIDDLRRKPIQVQRLLGLFTELGFHRFQDAVKQLAGEDAAANATTNVATANVATANVAIANVVTANVVTANVVTAGLATARELASGDVATSVPIAAEATTHRASLVSADTDYSVILTLTELKELSDNLVEQPMFAIDTETTGLGADSALCGISIAWKSGAGVYIPILSPDPACHLSLSEVREILGPVLSNPSVSKCGHNLKFDAGVLFRHGMPLRGVHFDSLLASTLIEPSRGGGKLANLSATLLGRNMIPIEDLIGTDDPQRTMDQVAVEQIAQYAAEDADISYRLYEVLLPEVEFRGMAALVRDIESPLSPVIAEMEIAGILCDGDELVRQGDVIRPKIAELTQQIYAAAGVEFNLNSTKQLAEILFQKLKLKSGRKTTTGFSTDDEVLEKLTRSEDSAIPATTVPRLILEYRQLNKLVSTYLGNLRSAIGPDGRIHSTFHQLVTATGRIASHGPNLQNIPTRSDVGKQIRKAFHAPEGGSLISLDYSQIELRMLAHLSEDPGLISAFEADLDIHSAVAAEVFGLPLDQVSREHRDRAKVINFGIIYGVTAQGLARRVDGLDIAGATTLIADYKSRYKGIDAFLRRCIQQALDSGWVSTIMGRRRLIPEIRSDNSQTRSLGERLAINTVVQGSAADLIKLAMVNVQNRIEADHLPVRMLLQIHDELVFETPSEGAQERAEVLARVMEDALPLKAPLKVEVGVGPDWMSVK